MASHQSNCGTFVIDPFDIEANCCMNVHEPVRPHQTAKATITLKNHEEVRLEGTLDWSLANAETGEVVDPLDGKEIAFNLDPGEETGYIVDVVPEEHAVIHTQINHYDDNFIATIHYALEEVRAPDEHNGDPFAVPDA